MIGGDRGLEPNKKVNGRKRQFLVDSGGRLWHITVHVTIIADGLGGLELSEAILLKTSG
jgi:hypothetical protein